jgi:hypothetical protein
MCLAEAAKEAKVENRSFRPAIQRRCGTINNWVMCTAWLQPQMTSLTLCLRPLRTLRETTLRFGAPLSDRRVWAVLPTRRGGCLTRPRLCSKAISANGSSSTLSGKSSTAAGRLCRPLPPWRDPGRRLQLAHYLSLFLFGLVNPILATTRALCAAS